MLVIFVARLQYAYHCTAYFIIFSTYFSNSKGDYWGSNYMCENPLCFAHSGGQSMALTIAVRQNLIKLYGRNL